MVKGNLCFCWASFCGNWCSAINLNLQPGLRLPKTRPFICVYTHRSLHAGSFPAFLWSRGRQREWFHVIWSCNFHVFTFPPASPVSLIPLSPTSCAAFSHFATSSPLPLLFCAFMTCPPHPNPQAFLYPMRSPLTGVQCNHYCIKLVY